MGKGVIVSGGSAGQYQISLSLNRARVAARLAAIAQRMGELDQDVLPQRLEELQVYQAGLDAALARIDQGISDYQAQAITLDELGRIAAEAITWQRDRDVSRNSYRLAIAERGSLTAEQTMLESVPTDPTVAAWCADLTENLAGNVGTMEIPGERHGVSVMIRPGFDSGAVYSGARDGQLQPTQAGTPSGTFYNWSMLPGWQKWQPQYRIGTLIGFNVSNPNLCTVTLDAVVSSAQGLNVNLNDTLVDVPIVYMDCHEAAFVEGDRVVIEFVDRRTDSPRVIGFETAPRDCFFEPFSGPLISSKNPWAVRIGGAFVGEAIVPTLEPFPPPPGDIAEIAEVDGLSCLHLAGQRTLVWENANTLLIPQEPWTVNDPTDGCFDADLPIQRAATVTIRLKGYPATWAVFGPQFASPITYGLFRRGSPGATFHSPSWFGSTDWDIVTLDIPDPMDTLIFINISTYTNMPASGWGGDVYVDYIKISGIKTV